MTFARYDLPRDQPFYWWGPASSRQRSRSLRQLVVKGTLSADEAAILSVLFGKGASMLVVSMAAGTGKSTLLDAITRSETGGRNRVYLRGGYETFDFLEQSIPSQTCLLVNEISPHLPMYLWGPGVRSVFRAGSSGFQLCATLHAGDAMTCIHTLTSPPLNVPLHDVHHPKVVIAMESGLTCGKELRFVRAITTVTPGATARATLLETISQRAEPGVAPQTFVEQACSFLEKAGLPSTGFVQDVSESRAALIDQVDAGDPEIRR